MSPSTMRTANVNELQQKLAERRSLVEGEGTTSMPVNNANSFSSPYRQAPPMHRRSNSTAPASADAPRRNTSFLGGRISKKELDSPPPTIAPSPSTPTRSTHSAALPSGGYEFLHVLQTLRRTFDSDVSVEKTKKKPDVLKVSELQADDDLTEPTASCSTSLSPSTRGRNPIERSCSDSSVFGTIQSSPGEDVSIKLPPRSPRAKESSQRISCFTPRQVSSTASNFENVSSNVPMSLAVQTAARYPRNDRAVSPPLPIPTSHIKTPKLTNRKQQPPNAPDRTGLSHKKAPTKELDRCVNRSPPQPFDEKDDNSRLEQETSVATQDVYNSDIQVCDDESVDSISGEFRIGTQYGAQVLAEEEFPKEQPNNQQPLPATKKMPDRNSEQFIRSYSRKVWTQPTNNVNAQNHGNRVPPHLDESWVKDGMGDSSILVNWPDNDNFQNHSRQSNVNGRSMPQLTKEVKNFDLPPVIPTQQDNSRNDLLVGRNIITSQSHDSCSTFAFSSPSSKDQAPMRLSPCRDSSSSSSVPSGLTINVLYKEIMKLRLQMEESQRADATKAEQLTNENRMLRGQLDEELARVVDMDRILHSARERIAEQDRIIFEEKSRVAEKERTIVELVRKLQEQQERQLVRSRQSEGSLSPKSRSSRRREERPASSRSVSSHSRSSRMESKSVDRRFEC